MSESKSNKTPSASIETQFPLKKRKMSENDTTEVTTTEDKRPSKNLIQLNLPKSLQSNVGNCHRNLEDHQVEPNENSEQDETLNVLYRYEKSHHLKVHKGGEMKYTESHSKNSETQQSQIDPVFYQQLLHKNTLEEIGRAHV